MIERIARIAEELKRELSDIVLNDLKDPRMTGLVSIVSVDVTRDLRYAKVYVSIFGSDDNKKDAMKALKSAAGFIRREAGHRMQLRYTPEIQFMMDDSIEHGVNISRLINETVKKDADIKKDTGI